MTALLGVFDPDGRLPGDAAVRRMLDSMRGRGIERFEVRRANGAVLAVGRHAWEESPAIGGAAEVVHDGELFVIADAAIYYRDELRRRLARLGIPVTGESASHHILAAYRGWGEDCARHLEGDFAFVVWNASSHRVCAARDYSGKRPLFYAQLGATLVVASSVGGVLAFPACPGDLNLAAIAETAAGRFASSHETAYEAIVALPGGCTLSRRGSSRGEVTRHWSAPAMEPKGALSFDDAADALLGLLGDSVRERLDGAAPTSVYLSGGWDSPAVFAAGQNGLDQSGGRGRLRPVSISYPVGDPGREDELIRLAAERWHSPIHWIDIADVPLFDRPVERAVRRDEPFAHPFEMWHRALARGARAAGARVALEGVGGDQLFQVSEVYFADLLRTFRWRELARDWKARGMSDSGWRVFVRWAVQPLLSPRILRALESLRGGRPIVGYLDRPLPPWIDPGFARRAALEERERAHTPPRRRGSAAAYETRWYLEHPYFPKVFGTVSSFALEEGVEIRSPLYDRRVIEFACSRPRRERSSGRETKLLLRRAMRGLLPDAVLAPRAARTGGTGVYFERWMRSRFAALADEVFKSPLLADAGIVDAEVLRRSCASFARGGAAELGVNLYFTLQTEWWLRARLRPMDTVESVHALTSAAGVS